MKRLVLGALVGMVIAYSWYSFSWLVLPWTSTAFEQFENEKFIGWMLKENAEEKGIYVIPYTFGKDQKEEMNDVDLPFAFVSIVPEGLSLSSTMSYVRSFAIQFVIAFLLACLVLNTNTNMTFMGRVFFMVGVALVSFFICLFSQWNWWGYSLKNVLFVGVDFLTATFLSALGIASLVKPKDQEDAA